MHLESRPLALITGASSDIAMDVAMICARDGYDLVFASCMPVPDAIEVGARLGVTVDISQLDLTDAAEQATMYGRIKGRPVELLVVDAREGLDPDFIQLIYRIAIAMRRTGHGKIVSFTCAPLWFPEEDDSIADLPALH
jgi:short-subunit dehydrogenase